MRPRFDRAGIAVKLAFWLLFRSRSNSCLVDDREPTVKAFQEPGLNQPARRLFQNPPPLILQSKNDDAAVASWRVLSNIREIQVVSHEEPPLLLDGGRYDRILRSAQILLECRRHVVLRRT